MLKVACVQLNSQTDILANLIQIESAVKTAVSLGVSLVVLPENAFCFGKQGLASRHFHALQDWCGKLAEHHKIHLLAGTLPCPFRLTERLSQTANFVKARYYLSRQVIAWHVMTKFICLKPPSTTALPTMMKGKPLKRATSL